MYEDDKLEEAEYFLKQMRLCEKDRKAHKYNLSAFLSAGRSVLQFAKKESDTKAGGQAWYKSQVMGSPVVQFFKDQRDVSIHAEPVTPVKAIQVNIEETLHFNDNVDAVVIQEGTKARQCLQTLFRSVTMLFARASPPRKMDQEKNSRVTVVEAYKFKDWKGPEDLPTLCSLYLAELKKIVADGQTKGYLTR